MGGFKTSSPGSLGGHIPKELAEVPGTDQGHGKGFSPERATR